MQALVPITLDVLGIVTVVLGVWPKVRSLRSTIANTLADFPIQVLDKLLVYALALGYAHTIYETVTKRSSNLTALAKEEETAQIHKGANALRVRTGHSSSHGFSIASGGATERHSGGRDRSFPAVKLAAGYFTHMSMGATENTEMCPLSSATSTPQRSSTRTKSGTRSLGTAPMIFPSLGRSACTACWGTKSAPQRKTGSSRRG